MKLSNKILIGFFGSVFVYLTAVFAEVRLRGTPHTIDDTNSIRESVDLKKVAVLTLRNIDEQINVIASDTPRLEVRSFSGNVLHNVRYNISGDTLTLSELRSDDLGTIKITLFLPESDVERMILDSAAAIVKGLQQDRLHIQQNAGDIWLSDSKVSALEIDASHGSYSHISATDLDTLSAKMVESRVFISSPLALLKGSMQKDSFLQLTDSDEIQFKKDESSRINWFR